MIQSALELEILQQSTLRALWSDWTDKEGFYHKVKCFCILNKELKVS